MVNQIMVLTQTTPQTPDRHTDPNGFFCTTGPDMHTLAQTQIQTQTRTHRHGDPLPYTQTYSNADIH